MRLERDLFHRLCQARDLLRDTLSGPRTIESIAREVIVSPFHFIRRFESLFGTTPNRFRTAWRIDEAKRLLAAGEHSVTEACAAVGFTSLGSFSTAFKRRVGMSPTEWLRRARLLAGVPGALTAELRPGCLSLMGHLPDDAFRSSGEAGRPSLREPGGA